MEKLSPQAQELLDKVSALGPEGETEVALTLIICSPEFAKLTPGQKIDLWKACKDVVWYMACVRTTISLGELGDIPSEKCKIVCASIVRKDLLPRINHLITLYDGLCGGKL